MKILVSIVVMSFICIVPIHGMERPPLSPLKNNTVSGSGIKTRSSLGKRLADGAQKENDKTGSVEVLGSAELTEQVTPRGKQVRMRIIKKSIASINGIKESEVSDSIHPFFETASPMTLKKSMQGVAKTAIYQLCQRFGITQEQIRACYPQALQSIQEGSIWEQQNRPRVCPALEKEAHEMAGKLGESKFCIRAKNDDTYASNYHNVVRVNEKSLYGLPVGQRAAAFAHEIMHGKHFDLVFYCAVKQAFSDAGKEADFQQHIESRLQRTCEVFADMGVGVSSPTLAKNLVDLREELHKRHMERVRKTGLTKVASSHPEPGDWVELDKEYVLLHEKHKEEKERQERLRAASKRVRQQLENEQVTQ